MKATVKRTVKRTVKAEKDANPYKQIPDEPDDM